VDITQKAVRIVTGTPHGESQNDGDQEHSKRIIPVE
jgi:hypothetical protein